jgi:hypothetical protein
LERIAAILDEECNALYAKGKRLYDQRQYRQALVPLSGIVGAASVYPQAKALKGQIVAELKRQEENRIKLAQAKAKEAEEKKLQAMHKAEEAKARADAIADSLKMAQLKRDAIADSLKIVQSHNQAKAAEYEFQLEQQENHIRILQEENRKAETELDLTLTKLATESQSFQESVGDLDDALEETRPPAEELEKQEEDGPWSPVVTIDRDQLAGKWELIKEESSLKRVPIESETLELGPQGNTTLWIVGSKNDIMMGQGNYRIDRDLLQFDFQEESLKKYISGSYTVEMRGDSRLYLRDDDGNEFAFCKIT